MCTALCLRFPALPAHDSSVLVTSGGPLTDGAGLRLDGMELRAGVRARVLLERGVGTAGQCPGTGTASGEYQLQATRRVD